MECEACGVDDHELDSCPYIHGLQSLLMSFCLPVWFMNESGSRVHGSMTVVDTGEAILGVTAGHVADRIVECCRGKNALACQVGEALLPPNSLIARHPDLDLATFRLSASLLARSGRRAAWASSWPPIAPALHEVVMLGGYPGIYRTASGGRFESDFASFAAPVTDLDERSFSVEIPLADSFSVSRTLMPPHIDLAGTSGGGVFRLVEGLLGRNQLVANLELSGIIYFGSASMEVLSAHPLTKLLRNGEFEF